MSPSSNVDGGEEFAGETVGGEEMAELPLLVELQANVAGNRGVLGVRHLASCRVAYTLVAYRGEQHSSRGCRCPSNVPPARTPG